MAPTEPPRPPTQKKAAKFLSNIKICMGQCLSSVPFVLGTTGQRRVEWLQSPCHIRDCKAETVWLYDCCHIGVPKIGTHQSGYITPAVSGPKKGGLG